MEMDDELEILLSEQRRELMAAKAVDSDLQFALQLQLQENMKASLPAGSGDAVVPLPEISCLEDIVPDTYVVSELLDDELAKQEQALCDRRTAAAEMKKLQDELNRRIHDHAFARGVLNVPDEQWANMGEFIHKPYGEGSSSTHGGLINNVECFKVFVKGLLSQETVKGVKKYLGGIGVAVTDMTDILVFEVSKTLEINEGKSEMFSSEEAELKGLIEGLNVAIMLGLERVNVVSDNEIVHQYVTGKQSSGQGKFGELLNEVTLLQKNFLRCGASCVEKRSSNLALKLAQDAIVSQVQGSRENRSGRAIMETCAICLEDVVADHMYLIDGCLHYYCFSCMKKHAEITLLEGKLPKCPHEDCKSELRLDSCKKFLSPEVFDVVSIRVRESLIPAADRIYCPYPKCSALTSATEVRGERSTVGAGQSGVARCRRCHGLFCINCRVPWHNNMTCLDYRTLNPYPSQEDARLQSLAQRSKWRQCQKCKQMVSLATGCYHIYCRCGHEFCYTCGAEWKNKKATCTCPIWDENNIIYGRR